MHFNSVRIGENKYQENFLAGIGSIAVRKNIFPVRVRVDSRKEIKFSCKGLSRFLIGIGATPCRELGKPLQETGQTLV
jgi:hypothetical protein